MADRMHPTSQSGGAPATGSAGHADTAAGAAHAKGTGGTKPLANICVYCGSGPGHNHAYMLCA